MRGEAELAVRHTWRHCYFINVCLEQLFDENAYANDASVGRHNQVGFSDEQQCDCGAKAQIVDPCPITRAS